MIRKSLHPRGPVFEEVSERVFVTVVTVVSLLLALAGWRVFVAHADGRRSPDPERVHGQRTVRQNAPRGTIVDRHGAVLARSVLAYDVEVECYGNTDLPLELANRILACLEMDRHVSASERDGVLEALRLPGDDFRRDLWQRADVRRETRGPWQYYWKREVASDVGDTAALRAFEELGRARYDGCRFRFRFVSRWNRVYPLGRAAAHVVGALVGESDGDDRAIGLEALPALVPGKATTVRELRNARGKRYLRDLEPAPFADDFAPERIVTTLDSRYQEVAFDAIGRAVADAEAEWGMILLVDLQSGDVLALAGSPTFDPEFRISGDRDWPMTHWARVEPGSVIKPLVLGLALERGIVSPGQPFVCGEDGGKTWRIVPKHARRSRIIKDDHAVGACLLEDILIQSSNIGAVKVGMLGGAPFHRELLELFRLGEAPELGLPLPQLADGRPRPGIVPTSRNFENKADYEVYTGPSLSFGYQLEIYPISFARAFASLVTGHDFRMRLIAGAGERAGPGERILSERTVSWIRSTLVHVVTDPRGTARELSSPDMNGWLAGKTGTTINERRQVSNASFVGFAPADEPRWLSMAVLMKRNVRKFYGGTYAAPAVRDLMAYVKKSHTRRDVARPVHERGESDGRFR
ncbi:MAG: hypothetical protein H6832_11520 [Planctomycetes bacterium]|nr:hypothetical protein [Planctomycetota bacterium]MCB9919020.1 hypothetical protein [Planctomycetota bacterium]